MPTLNSNLLLSGVNHLDTARLTGGNTLLGFPLSNIKLLEMWKPARFFGVNTANTYVVAELGGTKAIQLVSLHKHNLSQFARWRVRLANDEASLTGAPTYDSGWINAAPDTTGDGSLPWGEFEWGGVSAVPYQDNFNLHSYHPMPEEISASLLRIDIDDEIAATARPLVSRFIQLTRAWAGPIYQPSFNVPYGAQADAKDDTKVSKAESGAKTRSSRKVRMRTMAIEFDSLTKSELFNQIFGPYMMKKGVTETFVAIIAPLEPEFFHYQAVYGSMVATKPAVHNVWNRMNTSMDIEEEV